MDIKCSRCRGRALVVAAVLLLTAAGGARAAVAPEEGLTPWRHDLTVELSDGALLRDVALAWRTATRHFVVIRADGARREFPADAVVRALDRGGVDRRDEIMGAAASSAAPPSVTNPEIGDTGVWHAEPTLGDLEVSPWPFTWWMGAGVAVASSVAGDFPGSETVAPLTVSVRRRVYRTWYVGLGSTTEQNLAIETFPSPADPYYGWMSELVWRESALWLSAGMVDPGSRLYGEIGFAALERASYVKPGLRFQAGRLFHLGGRFSIDLAGFVMLKPGFENAGGKLGVDLGVLAELALW